MARLLSLWLPTRPTDSLRRHGAQAGPLATVEAIKGAQRIAAVDPAAAVAAIRPGMALADARAICPLRLPRFGNPSPQRTDTPRLAFAIRCG